MMRTRRHIFSRLWLSDPELAKFAQLSSILLLGGLLYIGLLYMLYHQWSYLQTLKTEYSAAQEYNLQLQASNRELERLDAALLPAKKGSDVGLDWETLRFLSFKNFQLIAPNEGVAYLKEFE